MKYTWISCEYENYKKKARTHKIKYSKLLHTKAMKIYILFNFEADVLSKWLSFYIFDDLAVYQQ